MQNPNQPSRRMFLQSAAAAGATPDVTQRNTQHVEPPVSQMGKRPLGKTGLEVSILGLGGFHLGATKDQEEATRIVHGALDAGINFFDSAWEYQDGESEARLGRALEGRRKEALLMTKVCTHGRKKRVAMQMLEESLGRLKTDHLDVWQIHEVVYENDPEMIFGPDGAAEALLQAKKEGKVRFVGFTGHKDPSFHLKVLSLGFPFDTVQLPLNPFDATFRSFESQVLPELRRQGIAALGMKSLGGSGEMVKSGAVTVEEALRYSMSLPVACTISGIDSLEVLEQNLKIALNFKPMSEAERQALATRCTEYAADGRLELFKTTTQYDGKVGREQHGYPAAEKLPA
ncbi:MAG TPA: aldo/keto reductase [Bryobacteraceae bacterium]|nr:aldo/keto reductase [Bryobacteraceae bacterium]